MDCIQCDICDRWLHHNCANLQFDWGFYISNRYDFICSKKCEWNVFPFSGVINSEKNDEFHPFRENYLCKICREDCLVDCIECDV